MNVHLLNELRQYIEALPNSVQESGLVCPFCNSKDKSLSVKNDKGMGYFICHRDSCGKAGRFNLRNASGILEGGPRKKKSNMPNEHSLSDLPEDVRKHMIDSYHLSPMDLARLGPRWHAPTGRAWLPLRGPTGDIRGCVLRSYTKGIIPKALTYTNGEDGASTGWYKNFTQPSKIIVVEDVVSAARASAYVTAVSLNSTHMDTSTAMDIAIHHPSHVVLCLDKDATNKALLLHRRWAGAFKKLTMAVPDRDLKDMEENELASFIEGAFSD